MAGNCIACEEKPRPPRVVIVGLASCFGCQLQITNNEAHLLEVLGQIDLSYWQLSTSGSMPADFDVAIIEGAVTTQEAAATVRHLREVAKVVISVGACANTAGIPGMAAANHATRAGEVYDQLPLAAGELVAPCSVPSVIDVDYRVLCCPIDPLEFLDVLSHALYGSNKTLSTKTMCGDCRRNETTCFYNKQELCLGLVTTAGCNARCVNLGRPCNGCRGLSADANLAAARETVERYGVSVADFDKALELFNQTSDLLQEKE
ncbi:MAG: NADH:ubiquinone oxidoreductase [Raoultibacter sp.]